MAELEKEATKKTETALCSYIPEDYRRYEEEGYGRYMDENDRRYMDEGYRRYMDEGYRRCSHEAEANEQYCILHSTNDEKNKERFEVAFAQEIENQKGNEILDIEGFVFPVRFYLPEIKWESLQSINANGTVFGDNADFRQYAPQRSFRIDFRGATFGNKTDFRFATFGDHANFAGATFSGGANFAGATFSGGANFAGATLGVFHDARNIFLGKTTDSRADFRGATFGDHAIFQGARFGDRANFGLLGEETNFQTTCFGDGAFFSNANFGYGADFNNARFGDGAFFGNGKIGYGANFRYATLNNAKFENEELTGADFSSVDLTRVVFKNSNLWGCHLAYCSGLDKCQLDYVKWTPIEVDPKHPIRWLRYRRRWLIGDEFKARRFPVEHKFRATEATYRQLKAIYERKKNFPDAGRFYYGEMEMRRHAINPRKILGLPRRTILSLEGWYWLLSGYGERGQRAIMSFIFIVFLFASIYAQTGFIVKKPNLEAIQQTGTEQFQAYKSTSLYDSALLSARVALFRTDAFKQSTSHGTTIAMLAETVLGPFTIGLFGLAVRRRFRRN